MKELAIFLWFKFSAASHIAVDEFDNKPHYLSDWVSVSVSKNFSIKKSLSTSLENIWFKKSLGIGLENLGPKKSLGIGLKIWELWLIQHI